MKVIMSVTHCQRIDKVRCQIEADACLKVKCACAFETWKAVTTQTCLPSLLATQFTLHVFNH
jgi:hypothetical protein